MGWAWVESIARVKRPLRLIFFENILLRVANSQRIGVSALLDDFSVSLNYKIIIIIIIFYYNRS